MPILFRLSLFFLAAAPFFVHAQPILPPTGVRDWFPNPLGPDEGSLLGIICNVRDGVFPILLTMGIIAFILSGLLYFTSGGSEERVKKAKKALVVAIIGTVLAFLAFGLPPIIAELFNVSASQLPSQCR